MSHPLLWPKKHFFYPIGNTSPVCLTQDLCPEESAHVLLLGCGDPRNILYTLHASAKSPGKARTLDFTCCDSEPAVLARNVLLFTLIVDGHSTAHIWNIFYHFKLDDSSFSLLVQQSEKLVAMSRDLDSWSSSPYFAFLRVCSRSTLLQLHHLWQLYSQARTFSKHKSKSLFAAFTREFEAGHGEKVNFNFTASRSAGPFWLDAVEALKSHLIYYWRTGTIFSDPADVAAATFINPTFIYSRRGEGCAVHYGTYPLQSFHLASAYAPTSRTTKDVTSRDLVSCAQSQLQQWCRAFKAAVSPTAQDTVRIRLLAGDALAFCQTLYHFHLTSSTSASLFLPAWTAADLILDGGDYGINLTSSAPTTFNVIETSNIIDHVGLLNIIIVAVPLLAHKPSSTFYTEALVAGKDPITEFTQRLCAEIPTISLLCGITPTAYVSNFTSHSNIHEVMFTKFQPFSIPQYHERIAWKIPYLGDAMAICAYTENRLYPSFEPMALAKLLFNIYYRMFEDEDILKAMRTATFGGDVIHYDRGTFAAFLGLVKSRVRTDWTLVMEHIFDMLHADGKLILGSNCYQELCCQLHLRGIYSVDSFIIPPKIDRSQGRFRGWKDVPLVVCVVVVVPRDKIKILEEMDWRTIGSPMLQCQIRSPTFHNIFSSIQLVFGSVTIRGSGSNVRAVVNEDTTGWSGTSSLVMSVWIPSFNLAIDPLGTQVGLGVHSTPITAKELTPKLGLTLTLFSVNLMDRDMVHILTEWPKHPAKSDPSPTLIPHSPTTACQPVSVVANDVNVSALAVKWEITDVAPQDIQKVHSEQVSPCVMKVSLGQVSKNLIYPFPINGKQSKLRIARKSGWIEVIAPMSGPRAAEGGFSIKNFPLLLSQDGLLTVWNVHRLNLEHLPVINVQNHKTNWIGLHVSLALSDRELEQREKGTLEKQPVEALVNVKDTLHCFFMRSIEPNANRIFGLSDHKGDGIYTIIFLNRLCLDLASHTLVADTCILPLTHPLLKKHGPLIAKLTQGRQMMMIVTTGEEIPAWKHLLPVFVERCRTTWSHKPATCQYLKTGNVPLSLELDQNPICECGQGVQLGALSEVPEWKSLAPFMTRVAFSPLFAVSYLESVGGSVEKIQAGLKVGGNRNGNSGGVVDAGSVACAWCNETASEGGKVLRCSRCKETSYCGQACQKADWAQHKIHCKTK